MLLKSFVLSIIALSSFALRADSITTKVVCHFGSIKVASTTGCSESGPAGVSGASVAANYTIPGYASAPVQVSVNGNVFPSLGNQTDYAKIDLNLSTSGPHRPGMLHVDFTELQTQAVVVPFADASLAISLDGLKGGCSMTGFDTACSFPGFTSESSTNYTTPASITGTASFPVELGTNFNFDETLNLFTTALTGLDGRGTGAESVMSFYLTDANGSFVTIDDGKRQHDHVAINPSTATPEPITLVLTGVGIGLLMMRRSRRA